MLNSAPDLAGTAYVYKTISEILLHQFRIHVEHAIDAAVGQKGMSLEEHSGNADQTFQHLEIASYEQTLNRAHANGKTITAKYYYICFA